MTQLTISARGSFALLLAASGDDKLVPLSNALDELTQAHIFMGRVDAGTLDERIAVGPDARKRLDDAATAVVKAWLA